jgi:hypothetical protein
MGLLFPRRPAGGRLLEIEITCAARSAQGLQVEPDSDRLGEGQLAALACLWHIRHFTHGLPSNGGLQGR